MIKKIPDNPAVTTMSHISTSSKPGAINFVSFSEEKKNVTDKIIQAAKHLRRYDTAGFDFTY